MISFIILKKEKNNLLINNGLNKTLEPNVFFQYKKESIGEKCINKGKYLILYDSINDGTCSFENLKNTNLCFASYSFQNQQFWGRRDKLGNKPFYYINNDTIFAFSNSIGFLKKQLDKIQFNLNSIHRFLLGIPPEKDQSFYKDIQHLPAGYELIYQNNKLKTQAYFNLKSDFKDLIENKQLSDLKEVYQDAILSRRRGLCGSELSGGLDSSGITSFLFHQAPSSPLHLFRHIQNDEQKKYYFPFEDEKKYSDIVINNLKNKYPTNEHLLITHNLDSSEKGIIKELENSLTRIGSPFLSSLPLFFDSIYESAMKEGVQTLFSGFGGDEVISSSSKKYIKELIYKKKWRKLHKTMGINYSTKAFIKSTFFPQQTFPKWVSNKFNHTIANQHFFNRKESKNIFFNYFKDYFCPIYKEDILNRITNNRFTGRIEENSMIARTYGIDYAYPYTDIELIKTYLQIPMKEKFSMKNPRTLYRQLTQDFLPKEVNQRSNKTSSTVPTVFYRVLRDYDEIITLFEEAKKQDVAEIIDINQCLSLMNSVKLRNKPSNPQHRTYIPHIITALQVILLMNNKETL